MGQTFVDLYRHGGVTFVLIALMSVVALGISIERISATWVARKRLVLSAERILQHLREGNRTMAVAVNSTLPPHPASELFDLILKKSVVSPSELKRMQSRAVRRARRFMWVVGTIGATAPFVGLFGTVMGIMEAFRQISQQGGGGFDVVSGGISEALITTAGGILVGVLAMVLFNYLQVQVGAYVAELRETVEEINESSAEGSHGHAAAAS